MKWITIITVMSLRDMGQVNDWSKTLMYVDVLITVNLGVTFDGYDCKFI